MGFVEFYQVLQYPVLLCSARFYRSRFVQVYRAVSGSQSTEVPHIMFSQVLTVLFVSFRGLQVLWGGRALRGPRGSQALKDLQERRAREETRARQELED